MLWVIIVGLVAGIIARFLSPGPNEPKGFILTTALGIAGSFLATFIGQAIGWYKLDQGAGLIAATVGALTDGGVALLENVRFEPAETSKDDSEREVVKQCTADEFCSSILLTLLSLLVGIVRIRNGRVFLIVKPDQPVILQVVVNGQDRHDCYWLVRHGRE